jgi:hypothetical protein
MRMDLKVTVLYVNIKNLTKSYVSSFSAKMCALTLHKDVFKPIISLLFHTH